jgi:hypothetical protein
MVVPGPDFPGKVPDGFIDGDDPHATSSQRRQARLNVMQRSPG